MAVLRACTCIPGTKAGDRIHSRCLLRGLGRVPVHSAPLGCGPTGCGQGEGPPGMAVVHLLNRAPA